MYFHCINKMSFDVFCECVRRWLLSVPSLFLGLHNICPFSLSFLWSAVLDFVLQDIKAASLRTLTSIVHLERTPKLSNIIDCTGTASYHGFLPVLVRNCIQAMIGENIAEIMTQIFNEWCARNLVNKIRAFNPPAPLCFLDPLMEPYPHQFATALFSFLYHLASYDAGGEALVSCGMMEALLKVHTGPIVHRRHS